jgi:hypothetical protein
MATITLSPSAAQNPTAVARAIAQGDKENGCKINTPSEGLLDLLAIVPTLTVKQLGELITLVRAPLTGIDRDLPPEFGLIMGVNPKATIADIAETLCAVADLDPFDRLPKIEELCSPKGKKDGKKATGERHDKDYSVFNGQKIYYDYKGYAEEHPDKKIVVEFQEENFLYNGNNLKTLLALSTAVEKDLGMEKRTISAARDWKLAEGDYKGKTLYASAPNKGESEEETPLANVA